MEYIPRRRAVVAVPARDEEDRIAACLEALDMQEGARIDAIVLFVNNTIDRTAQAALASKIHPRTRLQVIERDLPPHQANAGISRRIAMQAAARLAGPAGVLLTTDADGLVDPDWLAANLAAIKAGADVVAGWCELHPVEWGAIPARLHEDDARECAYDALCDEIHGRLDPDPADPLPRHTQHSGASIAVTSAAFARCGGIPPIPSGEDRAFIAALRRIDATVRHAPEVHVTVSGRTIGRAAGGMAETIRRRLSAPDAYLDGRLEPAADCARRARCRAMLRAAYMGQSALLPEAAKLTGLSISTLRLLMTSPYFGTAWEAVEAAAPLLKRKLVSVQALEAEIASARSILDMISHHRSVDRFSAPINLTRETL